MTFKSVCNKRYFCLRLFSSQADLNQELTWVTQTVPCELQPFFLSFSFSAVVTVVNNWSCSSRRGRPNNRHPTSAHLRPVRAADFESYRASQRYLRRCNLSPTRPSSCSPSRSNRWSQRDSDYRKVTRPFRFTAAVGNRPPQRRARSCTYYSCFWCLKRVVWLSFQRRSLIVGAINPRSFLFLSVFVVASLKFGSFFRLVFSYIAKEEGKVRREEGIAFELLRKRVKMIRRLFSFWHQSVTAFERY